MTWTARPKPVVGCIRSKTRFLLFPKRIGDTVKWLEVATWNEEYVHGYNNFGEPFFIWEPTRWVDDTV